LSFSRCVGFLGFCRSFPRLQEIFPVFLVALFLPFGVESFCHSASFFLAGVPRSADAPQVQGGPFCVFAPPPRKFVPSGGGAYLYGAQFLTRAPFRGQLFMIFPSILSDGPICPFSGSLMGIFLAQWGVTIISCGPFFEDSVTPMRDHTIPSTCLCNPFPISYCPTPSPLECHKIPNKIKDHLDSFPTFVAGRFLTLIVFFLFFGGGILPPQSTMGGRGTPPLDVILFPICRAFFLNQQLCPSATVSGLFTPGIHLVLRSSVRFPDCRVSLPDSYTVPPPSCNGSSPPLLFFPGFLF